MIENIILIIFLIIILALIGTVVYMIIKAFNHHEMNPDEFLGLLTILSSQVQTELDTYKNFDYVIDNTKRPPEDEILLPDFVNEGE